MAGDQTSDNLPLSELTRRVRPITPYGIRLIRLVVLAMWARPEENAHREPFSC
jgi:hypothetical protein